VNECKVLPIIQLIVAVEKDYAKTCQKISCFVRPEKVNWAYAAKEDDYDDDGTELDQYYNTIM
jgi:hypothetical protein